MPDHILTIAALITESLGGSTMAGDLDNDSGLTQQDQDFDSELKELDDTLSEPDNQQTDQLDKPNKPMQQRHIQDQLSQLDQAMNGLNKVTKQIPVSQGHLNTKLGDVSDRLSDLNSNFGNT